MTLLKVILSGENKDLKMHRIKWLVIGFLLGTFTATYLAFRESVGKLSKEKLKKLIYIFWKG